MGSSAWQQLANIILPALEDDKEVDSLDASTNGLINEYKRMRK